jgi:hypothetical protein
LEHDAHLTYVRQAGRYIIAEFLISTVTESIRYAVLLDSDFNEIAHLPWFTDALGSRLLFDHRLGTVREGYIYTLEELISIAENKQP